MVRYLVGELRLPVAQVEAVLVAFETACAVLPDDEDELDLDAVIRDIVERTMVSHTQVERIVTTMLDLAAKLEMASGDTPLPEA